MEIEIAYIVLITIVVAQLLWILLRKSGRGEILVTLEKHRRKGRKIEIIVSFICLLFWLGILVFWLINSKGDILSIGATGLICILWILSCAEKITRKDGTSEIREKGIAIYNGFYKYSKLNSYTWLEGNVLRFNYKNIFRQDDYVEIEINDKDTALKADEALGKYITKKA